MSFENDTTTFTGTSTWARRDLLRIGGVTVAAGALLAACGSESAEGPLARVGNAPTTTGLPDVHVTDEVLLRTAASVELSVVALYDRLTELKLFTGDAATAVTRFRRDHEFNAKAVNALVTAAGGEAWTCSNPRFDDVVAGPLLQRIEGTGEAADGTPIEPSDDPNRDALLVVNAMESLLASTHQSFVPLVQERALRPELIGIGEQEARHAAVIALLINPDEPVPGSAAPAAGGDSTTTTSEPAETPAGVPNAPGQAPDAGPTTTVAGETTPFTAVHAIPGAFGSLGVVQVVVGAPNDAGTRFTANIETASLNSYIYDHMACPA